MNSASAATANQPEALLGPAAVEQSIPERFAQIVAWHGDRIAVSADSTEWTYAELDQRSNALARQILERSRDRSEPVVLLMEHGARLIAAILGALKAGKIYLALDPSHSIERLSAMLADSHARLLIADQMNAVLANSLATGQLSILPFDDDFTTSWTRTNFSAVSPEAGAWLMYTSGSTGPPKGVWQNHRGIVHDADVYRELIQLTPADRLSLLTSCSLPASSTALFAALLNGAMLCPFHARSQGIERLAIWLREQSITIYHSVPTIFRQLARAKSDNGVFANLRLIRLGGEPVFRGDVEVFRQRCPDHCRLMNALSSTETGLICAAVIDKHTALPGGRVPVGRAVGDVKVFLVNEQSQPVENGCKGRIAVRSAYLRQGYWLCPDATAEKFRIDPHVPDTRIFTTNDLGRFLRDGNLEHLGRVDEVVKIRGLRVDLLEIEAALRATDLFEETAVTALEDVSNGWRLVAFVVPRPQTDSSSHAWRHAVEQLLPKPSRLLVLQELPRLASGKIDRVTLARKAADLMQLGNSKADPDDALELQLVRIWEKILAIEAVATMDDFFALGGDSLAAATMLAAVEKFCGVDLPASSLLEATTVQKLADLIRSGGLGETDLRLVALRLRGNKPPLYCVPAAGGDALQFCLLARYLTEDQPIFAFQPRGLDGRSPYLPSVEEMAKSYIDALRVHQPSGPYYLCGGSFGGIVAFEMARDLSARGEEVRFLGLFDSYGGEYPKHRKSLALRKRLKLVLLRFLPHAWYINPWYITFTLAWLKSGLKEQMRRWFVHRMIALDKLMKFRALRCPFNLRSLYIREVCSAARRRYKLMPFPGRIDLFRAEHQPPSDLFEEDPLLGWSGMAAGGIEVHQFPGDHTMYLREPVTAAVVAAQLGACLEQASGKGR
jgi:amino acid adenylation domain-containing protein